MVMVVGLAHRRLAPEPVLEARLRYGHAEVGAEHERMVLLEAQPLARDAPMAVRHVLAPALAGVGAVRLDPGVALATVRVGRDDGVAERLATTISRVSATAALDRSASPAAARNQAGVLIGDSQKIRVEPRHRLPRRAALLKPGAPEGSMNMPSRKHP